MTQVTGTTKSGIEVTYMRRVPMTYGALTANDPRHGMTRGYDLGCRCSACGAASALKHLRQLEGMAPDTAVPRQAPVPFTKPATAQYTAKAEYTQPLLPLQDPIKDLAALTARLSPSPDPYADARAAVKAALSAMNALQATPLVSRRFRDAAQAFKDSLNGAEALDGIARVVTLATSLKDAGVPVCVNINVNGEVK